MYELYTIAMLPLGLYNLQVTCTQHALMYVIVSNVNTPSVSSFTRLLSVDQFDKRSPQLMLLYACFFRTCINPSLNVHRILYKPNSHGCVTKLFQVS